MEKKPFIKGMDTALSSATCIQLMFDIIYEKLKTDGYCQQCSTDTSDFKIHISPDGMYTYTANVFSIPLSVEDKKELIYRATAIYLAQWLSQDKNAKQTLNSFATRGFCSVSEKAYLPGNAGTDPTLRSYFKRAEEKFRDMLSLYREQAQNEQIGYKPEALWKVSEKKLEAVSFEKANGGHNISPNSGVWYDFQDLCFISWIAEHKFPFYELLVYSKKLLTKSNTPHNEAIKEAYKDYFSAIAELKKCSNDRTYTISAIMLQQIEATFGHMAVAYLSRILEFQPDLKSEDILHDSLVWWTRYRYTPFYESNGSQPVDMPFNILGYREAVAAISNPDTDRYLYTVRKQLLKRGLLTEMLLFAVNNYPPQERPSWNDDDYHYAAEFFRKEYPIIEMHTSMDLRPPLKWSDEECAFIRKFYESFLPYGLGDLRSESQNARKERNRRYTKQST